MLYHLSLEYVEKFIPRIPTYMLCKENSNIKRICFSTSIEGALSAIPNSFELLMGLLDIKKIAKIPCIVHLYSINENLLDKKNIITNKELVEKKLVPDAEFTGETWLLKTPMQLKHEIIEIKSFIYKDIYIDSEKFIRIITKLNYSKLRLNDKRVSRSFSFWQNFNISLAKNNEIPITLENKRAFIIEYWMKKAKLKKTKDYL